MSFIPKYGRFMKRNFFLKIIVLFVLAISVAIYTSNILDDDEFSTGTILAIAEPFLYDYLNQALLFDRGTALYSHQPASCLTASKIFYIKMHEKSPPSLFSFPRV